MNPLIKCYFGMHRYKVESVKEVKNPYGAVVGEVIVSRCEVCGKIKQKIIYTDSNYLRQ